mmetsp:Transcript_32143/g.46341  ORF Transcript_32143/g.46341 Transcript_32143/m.46341 type:complete len:189 (+) Transcript_32143:316-882(+)
MDIKCTEVLQWIDKSHLCSSAADAENCILLWHKLVLTSKDITTRSTGRPKYSHFLCYRKRENTSTDGGFNQLWQYQTTMFAIPDIFYRGEMLWNKGIGLDCCYVGVQFLRDVAKASCVLDPFCGKGTVPAMANELGMSAVGVEISAKRCRQVTYLGLFHNSCFINLFMTRSTAFLSYISISFLDRLAS